MDGKSITVFSPMAFLNDGKTYDSAAICMFSAFDESTGTMQLTEDYQFLDYGLDLYAPQSTTDEDGNRIVIAWARMPQAVDGKWNGMMCIPRVVSVKNQQIYFQPHPQTTVTLVTASPYSFRGRRSTCSLSTWIHASTVG